MHSGSNVQLRFAMGQKNTKAKVGLPAVSLAEFTAAWPETETELSSSAAENVLLALLLPRGITDKKKVRRAIADHSSTGVLRRRDVMDSLVCFSVDLSRSLALTSRMDGEDPTKLLLDYADVTLPEQVVSLLESPLTRVSLRGNKSLQVSPDILLALPASLEARELIIQFDR
jgi:hypothetical protein